MGNADADNRLALPLGAAYLREASGLMRATLLGKARDLYAVENANLSATSAQATGLPLIVVTLVAGLVLGYLLLRAARWLRGRTNRVLNAGLVAAGVFLVVSLAWLAAA
jgi:FtsH-binding integral membrane protein